jgi:hypothetical protein
MHLAISRAGCTRGGNEQVFGFFLLAKYSKIYPGRHS